MTEFIEDELIPIQEFVNSNKSNFGEFNSVQWFIKHFDWNDIKAPDWPMSDITIYTWYDKMVAWWDDEKHEGYIDPSCFIHIDKKPYFIQYELSDEQIDNEDDTWVIIDNWCKEYYEDDYIGCAPIDGIISITEYGFLDPNALVHFNLTWF